MNTAAHNGTATAGSRGGYDPVWFDVLHEVEDRHFWFRARNRVIAAVVRPLIDELGPRARLLEVGCGNGNVLRVLQELCPGGTVTGLDLFTEGFAHARRRCDCALVPGNILASPFPDGSFDVVGMFDVLEHLQDDRRALRALFALLAPGGAAVLTVPAEWALWSYFDRVAGHYRRYDAAELTGKFAEAGFEVARVTSFMTALYPLMRLHRGGGFRFLSHMRQESALRDESGFQTALAELKVRPVINEVLFGLLSWESRWIASGKRLPFGTSLLVVARKPRSRLE